MSHISLAGIMIAILGLVVMVLGDHHHDGSTAPVPESDMRPMRPRGSATPPTMLWGEMSDEQRKEFTFGDGRGVNSARWGDLSEEQRRIFRSGFQNPPLTKP